MLMRPVLTGLVLGRRSLAQVVIEEAEPMSSEPGPVTALVVRDVIPGRERAYDEWARRAVSASARYGVTGHTLLISDPAAPTRRVLIAQFPDVNHVRAWDESDERNQLVRQAEEFSSLQLQRVTGLETWFALPGKRASSASALEATSGDARRGIPARRVAVGFRPAAAGELAAVAALHGAPRRSARPHDLCGHAGGDECTAGVALPSVEIHLGKRPDDARTHYRLCRRPRTTRGAVA